MPAPRNSNAPLPPVNRRRLGELVRRFHEGHPNYLSSSYNEAQLRIEFLNPFFSLLGWDVDNTAGRPAFSREVVSETSVLVGEGAEIRKKHPDYEFRVGGERLFFVKALKGVGTLRDLKTIVASADSKWDSGLFSMMEEDRLHLSDAVLPGIGDSNDAMKNLFSLPSPVSFAIIGCVSPSKTTLQPITEAFYATSAYAVIQQRRPSLPLSA